MILPSLFLAHGAPDLLLSDHVARDFLSGLGRLLPKPKAIVIVSAHWAAPVATIASAPRPRTVYDFSGWPQALYSMTYPAETRGDVIALVEDCLTKAGVEHRADDRRGFDHGVWAPLKLIYPAADVPVVQVSLQRRGGADSHFRLGEALAPLREQGVLVVGSGATVHNLYALAPEGAPTPAWATQFDDWLNDAIARRDLDELLSFPRRPETAEAAHPTIEHFLPLYVALGAGWGGGVARRLHHSYSYGSIGMACYAFGDVGETAPLIETVAA